MTAPFLVTGAAGFIGAYVCRELRARGLDVVGMDNFNAPGWGFIAGQQNHDLSGNITRDFATYASEQDWLVRTPSIFNPYTNTRTETIIAPLTLEPINRMRIELKADRSYASN